MVTHYECVEHKQRQYQLYFLPGTLADLSVSLFLSSSMVPFCFEKEKKTIIVLKHLMTWNEENSNQGITPRNLLFHHSNHNLILLTIKRIQGYFLVQI